MEKARRRRINNCLDQLRSLLPYTTTMKRDMASLLEQTVEYINTMHTVLNEEKPACLSKVSEVYQRKIEENTILKKLQTPKNSKRKYSSGGSGSSCSYGMMPQQQSPHLVYHGCSLGSCNQSVPEMDSTKRHCAALPYGQSIFQHGVSTPTGSYNLQPQHQIIEHTIGNLNNNNNSFMRPYISYGSDCKGGVLNSGRYMIGQSPLNQYGISPEQNSQTCSGVPTPIVQSVPPRSSDLFLHGEITPRQNENMNKDDIVDDLSINKAYNTQNNFKASNLVADRSKTSICQQSVDPTCSAMQMTNPPQWYHDYVSVANSFNPLLARSDNPTVNLLAPMDMSFSPPNDNQSTSPQFLGVDRLLSRERPSNFHGFNPTSREMGMVLKNPVSNMLNEVSEMNSTDYSARSFGSTERKTMPMFSSTKWASQPLIDENRGHFLCGIPVTKSQSISAPAGIVSCVLAHSEKRPQTSSSYTDKLREEAVSIVPFTKSSILEIKSGDTSYGSELSTSSTKDDVKISEITDQSKDANANVEKNDVNNNPIKTEKSTDSDEVVLVINTNE